jgi:hypothetical protein
MFEKVTFFGAAIAVLPKIKVSATTIQRIIILLI